MDNDTLPHDAEIERCVLACMLLDSECRDSRVQPTKFFGEFHRRMCQTVYGLEQSGIGVDSVTVSRAMIRNGWKCEIGDVLKVLETVPHTMHFKFYVDELVSVYKRRRLLDASRWLKDKATDPTCDPDDVWTRIKGVDL